MTKLAPVDYFPNATAPTFDLYLDRVTGGSESLKSFLRRAVGYMLTGLTSERVLFMLYGAGQNGKTIFIEIIRALLGDYAMRTPTSTLMEKRGDGIPNDVARLQGARVVSASESEEGARFATAQVKDMTGGDTLTARFMRAEYFEFVPEFKLILATNHRPNVSGADQAIWDRIRLVPFTVRIPDDERDPDLLKKLKDELPGILAWAVRGCLEWQRDGLGVAEEVRQATESYRSDMDTFADFIDERCIVHPDAHAGATALYSAYNAWATGNGERPVAVKRFGDRLRDRGFRKVKSGTVTWHGIGLLDDRTIPDDSRLHSHESSIERVNGSSSTIVQSSGVTQSWDRA